MECRKCKQTKNQFDVLVEQMFFIMIGAAGIAFSSGLWLGHVFWK